MKPPFLIALAIFLGLFVLFFLVLLVRYFSIWLQALLSGVQVQLLELIGMHLRRVDVRLVVLQAIKSLKAGVPISIAELETHDLAGGNLSETVDAVIIAHRTGFELSWEEACTMALAGESPLEYARAMRESATNNASLVSGPHTGDHRGHAS